MDQPSASSSPRWPPLARLHFGWGWWSLAVFLTLGLVLELLHGFKVGFYLNVSSSTRRLMWTLAHAHGTLLGLVHIAFSLAVLRLDGWSPRSCGRASVSLRASSVLLPGGFFVGGISVYDGDPGLGVLAVPVGGALLLASVVLTCLAIRNHG